MWVTLEQTTGLQRRASIATSSFSRAPNSQGPSSLPLESETLSLPYNRRGTASTSPRARFAENPIIGPTREDSSKLSRRKSALKSRSPNQLAITPSKAPSVDVVTSQGTSALDKPTTTNSSGTNHLPPLPSVSPKRHRATSMISSDNTLWSNHYLYPEDAIDSSRQRKIAQDFDQFNLCQRAHSLSDFNTREVSSEAMSSSNYESLDFSDNSRPVSTISSSATSSFSSTSTPPPVQTSVGSGREKKLVQEVGSRLDYSPFPATSAAALIKKHYYTEELATAANSDPLVSPLERLSSISISRPTINGRKRSGTVLPPKKPELVFEGSPDDSCLVLPIDSLLAKIEDFSIKPPARPPRSDRRGAPGRPPDLPPNIFQLNPDSHNTTAIPNELEITCASKSHLTINTPAENAGSIYGSAKSNLIPLPVPVINQARPTIKIPSKSFTSSAHLLNESRPRPAVPPKAPSRNSILLQPSGNNLGAPADAVQRQWPHSCTSFTANSGSEDEDEDFESAEEGDDQFWSAAQSSRRLSSLPHKEEASSPIKENPTPSSSNLPSRLSREPTEENHVPKMSTHADEKLGKRRMSIIGAFPRSESFADSLLSSTYSNPDTSQELSFEEPYQPPKAAQPLASNIRKENHPEPPKPIPSTQVEPQLQRPRRQSHLPPASQPESSRRQNARPPVVVHSINRPQFSPGSPYRASPAANSPPKSPFDNFRGPRTSSLEGLAALRNPNHASPQSPRKKTTASSAHLRQLSKILSFCAKDVGFDEYSSDEFSHPLPSDLGDHHQISPSNFHPQSPHPPNIKQPPPGVPSTWKNSMSKNAYANLSSMYGALEMRRQELIWELCETEQSFSMGLRQVIEIFAFPLRTPEGAWITGVPAEVAKLLDWLEDIVNLHSQMAFQAKNCCQYQTQALGLVVHISEVFLELTPKLEVYQPYLVRFSQVTNSIEEMVANLDSDFGEFVRMQSSLPECGRMSLTSFLLKPVQRLMKYPLFFKQLCDVTPPAHPDHEATVCLLHATDSMIRVLEEVKEREDEYEMLRAMEGRVKGLPAGFKLARRDRRLLAQGLLKRVQLQQFLSSPQDTSWALNPQLTRTNQIHIGSSPQSGYSSEYMGSSHSRNSYHSNSSQQSTGSSVSTGVSSHKSPRSSQANRENEKPMNFLNYPSSPANPFPVGSKQYFDWMAVYKPPVVQSAEELTKQSKNNKRSSGLWESSKSDERNHLRKSFSTSRTSRKPKESPVHVFVFSDIIILATRHSDGVRLIRSAKLQRKKKDSPSYYSVLEDVGVSRLVAVSDISGELDYPHLLKLDLIPFGSTSRAPISVLLTFPDRLPGSMQNSTYESIQKERFKWLAAFHQALRSTEVSMRSQTDDLSELLDPSNPAFQKIPIHAQERQERNWWSARHRLVAKELSQFSSHQEDFNSEPSEIDSSGSFNSNSSASSDHSSIVNHPSYLNHPHIENHNLLEQIKSSGLGLDLGF
ncbi:hypothetical protein MJO28_014157 [Puccinia striiformis f. sp. tritici]|uniref:Uncharacterized protein n=1 Tax=Puccinia striiformis f. sp. tritici TaxID=168172 RepID=A0ACC0DVN6_9BASI|nr:hypothetical protein MJO28_014157 [Puccinia striiformis f. sp. tritici]